MVWQLYKHGALFPFPITALKELATNAFSQGLVLVAGVLFVLQTSPTEDQSEDELEFN